jgi:NADH dehydrogenase FAD-containing subunit
MASRVVIAGLGDSGLLTAIKLARRFDVVGISAKPALVSGQELGVRLARPRDWAADYWIPFERFRGLDGVRTEQGVLTGVDLKSREVFAERSDGAVLAEPYDALVIATGVTNGFWRRPTLQSSAEIADELYSANRRLARARSVIVIGGGAAAVSAAANIAAAWPDKGVDLYFPRDRALVDHHWRTWEALQSRLIQLGVGLHPGYRAVLGEGFEGAEITSGPVRWESGQPPVSADAILWAVGRVRPNTGWLPAAVLDDKGFVRVTPELQVRGQPRVYAIGDVAATDPLRSSARNRADVLLASNIRADFEGRPLRAFRPAQRRWGSVLGVQPDGLEVFSPNGKAFRFPAWSVDRILQPWVVRRGIYRGIRPD